MHGEDAHIPTLVKCGLVHCQFETDPSHSSMEMAE